MRFIRLLLFVGFIAIVWPVMSIQAVSKPVVGVSSVYTERTGTFNVSVYIESEEPIAAGSFDIQYDPLLLTVQESRVAFGPALANLPMTSLNGADAGKLSIAWAQLDGKKMQGTILELPARVITAGVGETIELNLRNVQLFNNKGEKIAVQSFSGQIKPFDGEEKEHPNRVGVDKEWKIQLSAPYNPATLNEHTVIVKRGTSTVGEEIIITPLTNRSFSVKAKDQFLRGKHTLEITDQLRSSNGNQLKEPVRHIFTVQ